MVFPDVPVALREWAARGIGIWIYSSGSVVAQRAFVARTDARDLTGWLQGDFDTTTRRKLAVDSYRRSANHLGLPSEQLVYLSDVPAELDAADTAGPRGGPGRPAWERLR